MATAPAAGAAPSAAELTKLRAKAKKATVKAVEGKLPEGGAGLAAAKEPIVVKVASCKTRERGNSFAGFTCAWNAHGELAGRVPLRCNGKAKVDAKAKKVRKADCRNEEELQAPLLATPHDVPFGYFEDFSAIGDLWDELQASGSDLMREDLNWKELQPAPGGAPDTWNWAPFDALYSQALASGLKPVFTFNDAPCWAAQPPCDSTVDPPAAASVDEYAFAAAQIALRYPQLLAIEIWFEPNGKFWGSDPDPELFSSLVGQAAQAVHATGTGVDVYSGGLAPGADSPDKLEFSLFLDRALDAGGIQEADAIGFHVVNAVPFKSPNDPTDGYLGRMRIQVRAIADALADHGVSRPIAMTQLSYSSAPGFYSDAQQRDAYVSTYELMRKLEGVSIAIIDRLLDNGDGSKVQGFGVLRPNRSPKPAYCGLAASRGAPTPPGC